MFLVGFDITGLESSGFGKGVGVWLDRGMAHCYRCGQVIPALGPYLRRRIKTGEWSRRKYSKRREVAVTSRMGVRIVCQRCAKQLDVERARPDRLQLLELAIALVVFVAFLISKLFGW